MQVRPAQHCQGTAETMPSDDERIAGICLLCRVDLRLQRGCDCLVVIPEPLVHLTAVAE
jgi:hypothetical protein